MSKPTTEREQLCGCGEPSCKADSLGPYKTIERMQCYERTIANLRARLAKRETESGEMFYAITDLRAQLDDAHEVSLELCRWETWAVMQLSVDPDLHGEAMRAAATAKLAEATKMREAVDAVEAVYQWPETDAHDVVAGYEQHVRALLRAEVKNG